MASLALNGMVFFDTSLGSTRSDNVSMKANYVDMRLPGNVPGGARSGHKAKPAGPVQQVVGFTFRFQLKR